MVSITVDEIIGMETSFQVVCRMDPNSKAVSKKSRTSSYMEQCMMWEIEILLFSGALDKTNTLGSLFHG